MTAGHATVYTSALPQASLSNELGLHAMMDGFGGRPAKSPTRNATTESLVEYTKRSLEEAAGKNRAAIGSAEIPNSWAPSPGDTLDLSSKGAKELPLEVIEIIRDRVER